MCDCHNDFFCEIKPEDLQSYVDFCHNNGVEFLSGSYWSTKRTGDIFFDIEQRKKKILRPNCFALHIEDLWFVKNEEDVNRLLEIKPFSCSLTWNFRNALAGGSYSDEGLTNFGKNFAKMLENNKILLDFAHLNKKSFFELSNISTRAPYVSHTGFCFICDDRRNLDDEQIKFIINSGGFIGMFFYDKLNSVNKQSIDFSARDVASVLAKFVDRFGQDNIGIGSDFFGIEKLPKGLEDYSKFIELKNELLRLSMTEHEIEKIFYKNFLNYSQNLF